MNLCLTTVWPEEVYRYHHDTVHLSPAKVIYQALVAGPLFWLLVHLLQKALFKSMIYFAIIMTIKP